MDEADFKNRIQTIHKKYESMIEGLVKAGQADQLPEVMAQYQSEIDAVTGELEAPMLQEMEDLEKQIEADELRLQEEEAKEASDPFFSDNDDSTLEPTDESE